MKRRYEITQGGMVRLQWV